MALPDNGTLPIDEWQVNQLRLTAFLTPAASSGDHNWWQAVVGEPPDTKVSKPKTGGVAEEGSVANGKLALSVDINRVDWRFMGQKPDDQFPFLIIPNLVGRFTDVLDTFMGMMHRWLQLDSCPPIQRIAFGAVLVHPVESRKAGYLLLSNYLKDLKIDPDRSSDLLYQINRPRQIDLNLPDKCINRLSKWTLIRYQEGLVRVKSSYVEQLPVSESFGCLLELDINTSQDIQDEIPKELLPIVFHKLIDLGKEIAKEGDIP